MKSPAAASRDMRAPRFGPELAPAFRDWNALARDRFGHDAIAGSPPLLAEEVTSSLMLCVNARGACGARLGPTAPPPN
jgi:hypothetical protein